MNDDNRSIIPVPERWLANKPASAKRIISAMVEETLVLNQQERAALSFEKRRIGDHEFYEPDYRQIVLWAQAMSIEPEEVIVRVLKAKSPAYLLSRDAFEPTAFDNGRIVSLNWDLELLPLSRFDWVDGLEIKDLRIAYDGLDAGGVKALSPRLPNLLRLDCSSIRLDILNLAGVPRLNHLNCRWNFLEQLDLHSTPDLTVLDCEGATVPVLDLSPVPHLIRLRCGNNLFDTVNLLPVPDLLELSCWGSNLFTLELSRVPKLRLLNCSKNGLRELNLRKVPKLQELQCWSNEFEHLDLKPVPNLTVLKFGHRPNLDFSLPHHPKARAHRASSNRIVEIDLAPAPELRMLDCTGNLLSELNLEHTPHLETLICAGNDLSSLDLSAASKLQSLDCRYNPIELLDIRSNYKLLELKYDADSTRLIKRPNQHFEQ